MLGFIDLSNLTNYTMILYEKTCGLFNGDEDSITTISNLTSGAVFAIQVFVPIALIIMGMVDMGKAVMQQKEDDIKKAQQVFVTRLSAAAITFLVITVVKLVVGIVAGNNQSSLWECIDIFISGK